MALTKTSLASAVADNALLLNATSGTGAVVGGYVLIDGEFAVITSVATNLIGVRSRGSLGSRAAAHNALAPMTFGLASDFPDPPAGQTMPRPLTEFPDTRSVSVDQSFDPGTAGLTRNTTVFITKATAWLQTITGPPQSSDGLLVQFVSTTAAAHVITYTAGFSGNTTSSDIATFVATFGATITIMAQNGKWLAVSNTGVTIA